MLNFSHTYRRFSVCCAMFFSPLLMFLMLFSETAQAAMPAALNPVVAPPPVNKVDLIAALPAPLRESLITKFETGHIIKKKILATAFAVAKPAQVQDIDDIAHGFPRELLRRLENSNAVLTRSSPNLLSFTLQQEPATLAMVRQVANEHDSQFILAGEIRNAGLRIEKKYFGLWETRKRQIEIELALYDGVSGAMLARHTLQKQADDSAQVGREQTFGSAVFFASSYGKAIDTLLAEATQLLLQDLQAFPAMARILKIADGQIVLDAGAASAISTGDLASVSITARDLPVIGIKALQSQPQVLGSAQTSPGKLAIIQVQQNFAIAELAPEIKADEVKVGDFVRFDNLTPK